MSADKSEVVLSVECLVHSLESLTPSQLVQRFTLRSTMTEATHATKCKFCERSHKWFSIPTLAAQFDVDPETIRRRLYKVDHVKIGRSPRIPECAVNNIFEDTIKVSA